MSFTRELVFENEFCRIFIYSDRDSFIREDKITGERFEVESYFNASGRLVESKNNLI